MSKVSLSNSIQSLNLPEVFLSFCLLTILVLSFIKEPANTVASNSANSFDRKEYLVNDVADTHKLWFDATTLGELRGVQVDKDTSYNAFGTSEVIHSFNTPSQLQNPQPSHPSSLYELLISPNNRWVLMEIDHGTKSSAILIDLQDSSHATRLVPQGWGTFLAWHPDSTKVLYQTINEDVSDPGLWLVNLADGSHINIPLPKDFIPEGIQSASISPDGQKIIYSVTRGMSYGSSVWLCNIDGTNLRRVMDYPYNAIANLSWSPEGDRFAFTTLYDSPVPFADAGLWVSEANGENALLLAIADGGHGQRPLWSPNGEEIYYIGRDNLEDAVADYNAEKLQSSIRAVNITTGEERVLVPSDGFRNLDLFLTSDNQLLFVSDRNGTLEVWETSVDDNSEFRQITFDGADKRHPILIP